MLNSRVSGLHLRSATIVTRLTEHDDVTKITALRARAYVLRWAPRPDLTLGPAPARTGPGYGPVHTES